MALCGVAGLVLRIFLALLPILLRLMGRVQGLYSESMLDYSVVTKYYIFQARGLGGGSGSVGFLYMSSQSMLDFSVVTKYYIFQARGLGGGSGSIGFLYMSSQSMLDFSVVT